MGMAADQHRRYKRILLSKYQSRSAPTTPPDSRLTEGMHQFRWPTPSLPDTQSQGCTARRPSTTMRQRDSSCQVRIDRFQPKAVRSGSTTRQYMHDKQTFRLHC